MQETPTLWARRQELALEAQRCDASSRFMLLAFPLYILFPVFLIAVVPVFIIFRRRRYLCDIEMERLRKRACKQLEGSDVGELGADQYARWVVDPFSRRH